MAELFDIGHEVDLSEYTSTVTDSGDLSQGSPGLAGTDGRMECLIDDDTNIYGIKYVDKYSTFRYRFYVDPNTLTMADGNQFAVLKLQQRAGAYASLSFVYLSWHSGVGYRLEVDYYNDAGYVSTDILNITDEEHYVEVNLVRAANDASDDGTHQWWVDGIDQGTVSNIDNFNMLDDDNYRIIMGAITGIDFPGTQGTFYLDELLANDDGSEIGPVSIGDLSIDIGMDEAAYQGTGVRIIS